jgi:hypothetical protein
MKDDDPLGHQANMARRPRKTENVGPLEYRSRGARLLEDQGPRHSSSKSWHSFGIKCGLALPFLILFVLLKTEQTTLTIPWVIGIWIGILSVVAAAGVYAQTAFGIDGFLRGLVIGTMLSGGLCGLLYSECSSSHI